MCRLRASFNRHRHHQADRGRGLSCRRSSPYVCRLPGAPAMTPLICYEVIFPACGDDPDAAPRMVRQCHRRFLVRPLGRARISIFSPRACARSKKALPIARAANTGISAVIDRQWARRAPNAWPEQDGYGRLCDCLPQLAADALCAVWRSCFLCSYWLPQHWPVVYGRACKSRYLRRN